MKDHKKKKSKRQVHLLQVDLQAILTSRVRKSEAHRSSKLRPSSRLLMVRVLLAAFKWAGPFRGDLTR